MLIKKITLLLFLGIVVLMACKKEPSLDLSHKKEPPLDFSHFEGDFYVEKEDLYTASYHNDNTTARESVDAFVNTRVENDTLIIFNYSFPITSPTQTTFEYSRNSPSGGVEQLEIKFFNNYQDIYIKEGPNYSTVSSTTTTYRGTKQAPFQIAPTGQLYNLWVERKTFDASSSTSQDTQYRKDIVIDYQSSGRTITFNLDGEAAYFADFLTYGKERENRDEGYYSYLTQKDVYWKNDSFYLEHFYTKKVRNQPIALDTVYYLYKGRLK